MQIHILYILTMLGIHGVLFGVLGVLFGILGVLVGVIGVCGIGMLICYI